MAPSNQDSYFLQEPKARLHPGMTGPMMAADTPRQEEPQPNDRKYPNADDYAGLQVVETGLEVVPPCPLPEAVTPQLQQWQYAEYKPWPQFSPPQPHPDAYSYTAPVTPGSTNLSSPYSGDIGPNYPYNGGHNPFGPPRKTTAIGRVCGLRKLVFWAIVVIVGFAIVAGVAIGVGVGLGTRTSVPAASTTASSTASSTASTATDTFPAATATATAGPELYIICPSANRTLYSLADSSSNQKFLVLCGRDYNSNSGAVDMRSTNTTTFEGCIEECDGQYGCVAVGWGNYYGVNTCWLKSAIGEPNVSESWYSAVVE